MTILQTQITTQAVIINTEGKILLLKRNKPCGWFTLPGGTVNEGETVQEALEREVFEETGLKVTIKSPLWIWQSNHIGKDLLGIVFSTEETVQNNIEITLSNEHSEYKWISVNGLFDDETVDPYIKRNELKSISR